MRVIAGTHRGRRLRRPQGMELRPTSDRVREALFSILGNRLSDSNFLDLYAGTGAIAIEAVSRGASHVTCVESGTDALQLLRQNMLECGMAHGMTIRAQSVKEFLSKPDQWGGPYDIVFADPPYAMTGELQPLFDQAPIARMFADDAWLIIEHAEKVLLPDTLGAGVRIRCYRYGDTMLSLYAHSGTGQS